MPTLTEGQRFTAAFVECLRLGVYPGPTILNELMGHQRYNKINGRLSKQRLELMRTYNVPYQRDGAYGDRGEVPNITPLTATEQRDRRGINL